MKFELATKMHDCNEPRAFVCDKGFKAYESKAEDGSAIWVIEGYASTNQVDRGNEIVEPSAFEKYLPQFLQFPIMLLNHEFRKEPVGKFVSANILNDGLWVKGEISQTDKGGNVWTLIRDGVLKAFSIGFRGHKIEITDDDRPDVWKEIELIEISVVNVPANSGALFAVAQARGLDLGCGSLITKEEHGMDPKEITKAVAEHVEKVEPALTAAAEASGKAAATTVVVEKLDPLSTKIADVEKQFVDIKEAVQGTYTKAELDQMVEKVKADFVAMSEQLRRLTAPGIAGGRETSNKFMDVSGNGLTPYNKSFMSEHKGVDILQAKAFSEPAEVYFSKDSDQYHLLKDLQVKGTNLHLMHQIAYAHDPIKYRDIKALRYWQDYKLAEEAFRKAMTTGTAASGGDWVPTGFSPEIFELVSRYSQLEDLFEHFPMQQKSVEWPFETSIPLAYAPDEVASITEASEGTDKVTITAGKLAVYVTTSSEWDEDAIVSGVDWLRRMMAKGLANGFEDALCQGDTAATHEDDDTQNPIGAGDRRKRFKGFKASANDGDGTTIYRTTATNADGKLIVADLRSNRASMGEYGSDPRELVHVVSVVQNIYLLDDTSILTVDKFGSAAATILRGELAMVDGVPIRFSTGVPQNMSATAVYDDTEAVIDRTVAYTVHRPSWIIGDRRLPTMETGRILQTDKIEILATRRVDFKSIAGPHGAASAPKNVWMTMNLAGD